MSFGSGESCVSGESCTGGYLLHGSNRPSLGLFVTKLSNESPITFVILNKSHQITFMLNDSDFCLAFRVSNCYQLTNFLWVLQGHVGVAYHLSI